MGGESLAGKMAWVGEMERLREGEERRWGVVAMRWGG